MKKFRFPLQQVLEIRDSIEKQRQGEFVAARQDVSNAEQTFENMLRLQKGAVDAYREQQVLNISPHESRYYYYLSLIHI